MASWSTLHFTLIANNVLFMEHSEETSKNIFWLKFTMVAYDKIYLEAYSNNKYIWHTKNTAQLYFVLWTASLHWKFPNLLRDALIFTDLQQGTWLRSTSFWKICEYQRFSINCSHSELIYCLMDLLTLKLQI